MFEAFVLVCAANINQEIYQNSCFVLKDNLGTFNTAENCEIRADQLEYEVLNSGLNAVIVNNYNQLGVFPELLYAEGKCFTAGEKI